jgi:hypothetical protein
MAYGDALSALLLRKPRPLRTHRREVLAGGTAPAPACPLTALSVLCLVEHRAAGCLAPPARLRDSPACGLCEANCPRRQHCAQSGKPTFGNRCVFCLRCGGTPARRGGLSPHRPRLILKEGFDLAAVEARTWNQTRSPQWRS